MSSRKLTSAAAVVVSVVLAGQTASPARTLRLPATAYQYAMQPLPTHLEPARLLDNTPPDAPVTNAGATLGRVLFYDTALSANNTTACASCHVQRHAFADPNRFSTGFEGRLTDRHAMNLTGLRYHASARFFWDERGGNLEEMVLLPVQDPIEMGQGLSSLPQKLAALPYYPDLFRRAFGTEGITGQRIARALAQFLRSMVSYRSRFDEGRARIVSDAADFPNFTRRENHGKALFLRSCATCHLETDVPLFGTLVPINNGAVDALAGDGGLADITLNALDLGRFKSPTLRNVEVAGPYMHDGSLATLEDVVDHYSASFRRHPNLDFRMAPLNFTASEKASLVAFLRTLTDRAFLTDPKFSDPFSPPLAIVKPIAPATVRVPDARGVASQRGDVEDVLARVMRFDTNRDGEVASQELVPRMRGIVPRGDTNRSGGLDALEVRAIVSASAEIGFGVGVVRTARQLSVTVRNIEDPGLDGLLADLKLPSARLKAALEALTAYRADLVTITADSVSRFRADVREPLNAQQLSVAMAAIERHQVAVIPVFLKATSGVAGRPTMPLPRGDIDRAIAGLGIDGGMRVSVEAAVDAHLERIRTLATSQSELLRRLGAILSSEELRDYAASLDRHRADVRPVTSRP